MRMICGIVFGTAGMEEVGRECQKNLPPDIFVLSQFAVSTDDNFSHFFWKNSLKITSDIFAYLHDFDQELILY